VIQFWCEETVTAGIQRFQVEQQQRAMIALERFAVQVESRTKGKLKWRRRPGRGLGGRATGHLANSYTHELQRSGQDIEVIIGTGVKYAKYVEGQPRPPKRHFVKFSTAPDLFTWLIRHGVEVPHSAKGWMVGGEKSVTAHLGPAFHEVAPKALAIMAEQLRVR
jgi:hypothetical protein